MLGGGQVVPRSSMCPIYYPEYEGFAFSTFSKSEYFKGARRQPEGLGSVHDVSVYFPEDIA